MFAALTRETRGPPEKHARSDALIRAAQDGHTSFLRSLLKGGAAADARDSNGWTALIHASAGGYNDVVRLLLAQGADPGARTRDGSTAAELAKDAGHTDIVSMLEEAQAQ